MRELSKKFLNDLKSTNGFLRPVFERVKQDHTLMLAIRDSYVNIYYRGGNLLKVREQANSSYRSFFDDQYNKTGKVLPSLPTTINNQNDAKYGLNHFRTLKK